LPSDNTLSLIGGEDGNGRSADAIVVGLGAMGSAALAHLARSGASVVGFDRFSPPHPFGSSHGGTRITRLAIAEGSDYVPLVLRSHELWRELERWTGTKLLTECGGLTMAQPGASGTLHGVDDYLERVRSAAREYGIEHENLGAGEIAQRFPQFDLVGGERGYYEPGAGFLRPERCIAAQLQLAARHGATRRLDEAVTAYASAGDGVTVTTKSGSVRAAKLIVATGAWMGDSLPEHRGWFRVHRQVLFWFALKDSAAHERYREMPIYIWETGPAAEDLIYGFPAVDGPDGGAKLATEQYVTTTAPDELEREVRPEEIEEFYERFVRDRLPGLDRRCLKATACMYTVTPDSRFVIDRHPEHENVLVVSACSGHGFKHSAAIGEAVAQLVTNGRSDIDLSGFSFARLGGPEPTP
jgi:sarcosine oxidase